MKKILAAVLLAPLMALAQSYPSPTFKTATLNGVLTITPPANSTTQAINTTQSSPTSGSVTGPYFYNYVQITNDMNVTTNPLPGAVGWYEQFFSGGANQSGDSIAMFIDQNHNVASSSGHDHIAFVAQEFTSVADTSGGEEYGANFVAIAANGANTTAIVGQETDVEIDNGATVPQRWAIRAVNQGANQASGNSDSAYSIANTNSAGAFKYGFLLSNTFGQAPLSTGGDMFATDAPMTIAAWDYLPNLTVTGWIMNFPNYTVSGAGAVNAASLALTTPLSVANGGTGQPTLGSFGVLLGNGAGPVQNAQPGATGQFLISTGASANPAFGNTVSTLTATSTITPSQTAGIVGTTTNNNANAGSVGELKSNSTTGTSMTTGTAANCTSVSLTAGDWDISGTVNFVPAAGTTVSYIASDISSTTGSFDGTLGASQQLTSTFTTGALQFLSTPVVRESLSGTTTIFLIGFANFATSTMTCSGIIRARRVR